MQSLTNGRQYDVDIILATYNGAAYIEAQLNSLLLQTYTHWRLLVRDDGSKDNTVELVRRYSQKHPQIQLIEDGDGNLGFNQNFFRLIQAATSPYISICDQDDVWLPEKLMLGVNAMKAMETPGTIPALVHSDAIIVDSHLNVIAEHWIGDRGTVEGLNGIAFANSVQGASVVFNQALKQLALTTPLKAPYDYHLALIAVLKGKRQYIPQALLKYRQHNNNAIGSMGSDNKNHQNGAISKLKGLLTTACSSLDYSALNPTLHYSFGAYDLIKHNYSLGAIVEHQKKALTEYFYVFEGHSRIKKLYYFIKNRYQFSSRKDKAIFCLLILLGRDLKNPNSW